VSHEHHRRFEFEVREPALQVLMADPRLEVAGALSFMAERSIDVFGCADRIDEVVAATDSVEPDVVVVGPSMLPEARRIASLAGASLVIVAPSESAAMLGGTKQASAAAEDALQLLRLTVLLGSLARGRPAGTKASPPSGADR
jgi:hypothetical protein